MVTNNLRIHIIEVGPRDGLQNAAILPTNEKIRLIDILSQSGLESIQVASFVHPKWVPQMADAEAVCEGIQRNPAVTYTGLALNVRGVERAHKANINAIDISLSASSTHNKQNANKTLEEAKQELGNMHDLARSYGMTVRGGIQCAFNHPADDVTDDLVIELVHFLLEMNFDMLSLADSTGMASPTHIKRLLNRVIPLIDDVPLVLHLHDTRGMGLANVVAAVETGCEYFDTAFGGMGGCNFIKGALGNIPTEDTVNMLHMMGYETNIDLRKVATASKHLSSIYQMQLPGKLYTLV